MLYFSLPMNYVEGEDESIKWNSSENLLNYGGIGIYFIFKSDITNVFFTAVRL